MKKIFLTIIIISSISLLINHASVALCKSPGDITTIYVFLNFEGSGSFPSITSQRDTTGLARFTGEAFNLPSDHRDELVSMIINRVKEDYQNFSNVVFVTDTSGLDWWYTWGIDDSAFVYDTGRWPDWLPNPANIPIDPYSPCPANPYGECARLYGKAGSAANIYETDAWGKNIFHPMHARTFAGSFALGDGCADHSEPPLFWGDSLPGTGKSVDLNALANALGNSASHEIGHMFGARDNHGAIMEAEIEKREAFFNKSFSQTSIDALTATLIEAATADQFEPSDLPLNAVYLSNGDYPGLTLDNPFDEDFYQVAVMENEYSKVRFSFSIDRTNYGGGILPLMNHWANVEIRYRDSYSLGSVWASHRITDYGYVYEEEDVPSGRIYEIHVFQFAPRQPIKYGMEIVVGEYIPPDRYDVDIDTDFDGVPDVINENDSQATATEWSSGCNFSGDITIHDDSDVDWYKIEALGYSVEAKISFDPSRGNLQLYLDDIQATESTLSSDGTKKTLTIAGCGLSPSKVRVQGDANYYSLCIQRIPLQEGCEGYQPWITFTGSGMFHFRRSSLWSPEIYEGEVPVNKQMFAKLLESSTNLVTWQLCGTVDYGNGFNQLFIGNLEIPRPNIAGPVPFSPALPGNPYILREAVPGRVAWYQVPPVGQGEGTFEGPDDAIVAFNVMCEGLQWNASIPDDQGTLIFEASIDTDGDLIADEEEIVIGTNPNCDDSDGDGLLDGTEDTNQNGVIDPGETDPQLWDTDGDGVSDGVERGLTSPEGNDTDSATFKPDSDPSTTTDPTRSDTDGDGLSDGEEDANQNGRLDPCETSPIAIDNTPIGFNVVMTIDNVTITFNEVICSGSTTVTVSSICPILPANFQASCTPPVSYSIATTAVYRGTITVCISYDESACEESDLHLLQYNQAAGTWVDVTFPPVDTSANVIRGQTTSLSQFILAIPTDAVLAFDCPLQFDGIDDYFSTPYVLNPAEGPFTVVAWIRGGAPGQVIISQKGVSNWLLADPSKGMLMSELGGRVLKSGAIITDGIWHYVHLVWDGFRRTLYVDGVTVAADPIAVLQSSNAGLYIGAGRNLEAGSFWSGMIDEVRIYKRVVIP